MRETTVEENIQNVGHMLWGLFAYICIVISAFCGYWKMLTVWHAVAVGAPALAIYLFGSRSLRLASKVLEKGKTA